MEPEQDLVARAIAREPDAVRALVTVLRPTIQARVVRGLMRSGRARGRNMSQEVEDLCQDVFLALFDDDAKALRAWTPERGALGAFVSVIAVHQVASILRSGKRRPWRDDEDASVDTETIGMHGQDPEALTASSELWEELLDRLRAELSPKGIELFHALIVDEQSVEQVQASTGMTRDAVYAWRSRLLKLVRKLITELQASPSSRRQMKSVSAEGGVP